MTTKEVAIHGAIQQLHSALVDMYKKVRYSYHRDIYTKICSFVYDILNRIVNKLEKATIAAIEAIDIYTAAMEVEAKSLLDYGTIQEVYQIRQLVKQSYQELCIELQSL